MIKNNTSNEPGAVSEQTVEAHEGAPFVLKALVIGLGILLVAGLAVVLSTIIYRSVKSDDGHKTSQPGGRTDVSRPVDLKIDPQAVKSIMLNGNRVAVQTNDEIVIIDYRRGQIVGRIRLNGEE